MLILQNCSYNISILFSDLNYHILFITAQRPFLKVIIILKKKFEVTTGGELSGEFSLLSTRLALYS